MSYREFWILCALVSALIGSPVWAIDMESLVMPGPVIRGHAKYEKQCTRCHAPFSKEKQSSLCRDCHEKVDADLNSNKGHHGRSASIQDTGCKHCHTEHQGRKADIVRLDREMFDHRQTDFELKGVHTTLDCSACHVAGSKFREAKNECIDCHKKDDIHQGRLKETCSDCHKASSWKQGSFDHEKTKFSLQGAHKKATCESCHPNQRYKETPTVCRSCHLLNDVHLGRYGERCDKCHRAKKWDQIYFNHDRDTKYRLQGQHKTVTCDACHTGKLYGEKLETQCFACHKADDFHQGRNGSKCEKCHSSKRWKEVRFDHTKDTDFPLHGKHAKLSCESCHKGSVYKEELDQKCYSCHRLEDVHKGQEGRQCDRCHNEKDWGQEVIFEHHLPRFPLVGQHAVAPCEECHLSAAFRGVTMKCAKCHQSDDVHKKQLGLACGRCHNPNAWTLWQFDHDKETEYPLDGAHKGLTCVACHQTPVTAQVQLSAKCIDCHRKDDVHSGGYGSRCDRCHETGSFKKIPVKH